MFLCGFQNGYSFPLTSVEESRYKYACQPSARAALPSSSASRARGAHIPKTLLVLLLVLVACSFVPGTTPPALAETSAEYQNAKLVFNIARYAEWSRSEKSQTLRVCVSKNSPLRDELILMEGRVLNNMRLEVSTLGQQPKNAFCHLAVLSHSDAETGLSEDFLASGSLTISTGHDFAAKGIVSLVNVGRQKRFIINNSVAKSAGVNLSSRLLRVALEVK